MYKTIYIPVDNSDHSNMAVDLGVRLAQEFGSKIVGSHVYATDRLTIRIGDQHPNRLALL